LTERQEQLENFSAFKEKWGKDSQGKEKTREEDPRRNLKNLEKKQNLE